MCGNRKFCVFASNARGSLNSNMKTKIFLGEKTRLCLREPKAWELKWVCRLKGNASLVPTEFVNKVVVSWQKSQKIYAQAPMQMLNDDM